MALIQRGNPMVIIQRDNSIALIQTLAIIQRDNYCSNSNPKR